MPQQAVDGGPAAAITTEQARRRCHYFNANAACASHDGEASVRQVKRLFCIRPLPEFAVHRHTNPYGIDISHNRKLTLCELGTRNGAAYPKVAASPATYS